MAAMKLKREQDTVEAAVRHRQLEDNLATLAREMEAKNDALTDAIAQMSDGINKAQAENTKQLGAMADSFKEQMQEMFKMLSGQIANLSAGNPAPDPNQDVSDMEQHRRDNSHYDCRGPSYTDDEWQKWNDAYTGDDAYISQRTRGRSSTRSPRGTVRPKLPVVPKNSGAED